MSIMKYVKAFCFMAAVLLSVGSWASVNNASSLATSPYCETQVYHLGIPAEVPSSVFMTISNVDATTMIVEIESADADPVDLLIVANGSGATISGEDTSVPGKISRTLTWMTPPTNVDLNVLWSKASFGGNWQLSPADVTVAFADDCPTAGVGAELANLTVDGNTIAGFNASVLSYSVELPFGTSTVPTVDAATLDPAASYMVNAAASLPGTSTVDVTSADGMATAQYSVEFTLADDPSVSNYCGDEISYHLGITAETASIVYVTITNVDANTMLVSIESADADPVDDLVIAGAAGGTQSGLMSNGGVLSKTITWGTAPSDVVLNVLWSKASFGGNWQLSPGDITVPFAASCPLTTLSLTVDASCTAPSATEMRLTGPFWGWDPAGGPVATNNGDGTWTVVLDPIPAADMEYLWVADGVQENLLDNMPQDLSCTPVTDGAAFANRQWTVGSSNVTGDTYDSCTACPTPPLTLTVDVCDATPSEVRMTGPFWGWDPAGGPVATDNGDGTWSVVLDPAPAADMEYLWILDGVQENLIDNTPQDFSCTPITDGANFANRLWTVGSPDVTGDIYDECSACGGATGGGGVSLTVEVCDATVPSSVRMTGAFWGWDPNGGPIASYNGDGTWTVTLDPAPAADMEYLWVVDGVQENLLDNMPQDLSCTPVTDGAAFANRQWTVGSPDVTGDVYDSCTACGGGAPTAITLTVEDCTGSAAEVRMTGAFWGWDPVGGPIATSNGDGTWTVTLDPIPGANMEYLWVVDGVLENLLDNSPQELSCTPITDGANFANRLWNLGDPSVSGEVYDSCTECPGTAPTPVSLTVDVCDATPTEVRMTGAFWGWDPNGGPVATDNGDGTWTVTLDPAPGADMEYLWVLDGTPENLLDNDPQDLSCTPITDGANFANRLWTVGSPDVTGDVYDSCGDCGGGVATMVSLTVEDCSGAATEVRLTGPFWGWDPAGGPVATNNGDGTWTVTLDPAPAADMEYLWVLDGVQENLLDNDPQDLSCTPITNGADFANRLWTVGSPDVTGDVYDKCTACFPGTEVTFQVDMNQYAGGATINYVNVSGEWNGFCLDCNQLSDDDMDGIYTLTIPIPEGDHYWKYQINGFEDQEIFDATYGCAEQNGSFYNRTLTVGATPIVLDLVCWNSCFACPTGGQAGCTDPAANNYDAAAVDNDGTCLYDVTFGVDMNTFGGTFSTVEVNGTFNGFCGNCNPMTDNGDGTWSLTIPLEEGNYDYQFTIDGGTTYEGIAQADCTVSNFGFTNRALQVEGATDQGMVCWASCDACPTVATGCTDAAAQNYDAAAVQDDGSCTYLVDLSVDMTLYDGGAFGTVYVSGAFNGWNGLSNPMDDSDMDGIWTVQVVMPSGDQEYKFTIDDWADQENFIGGESCTVTDNGFTNRVVSVNGDTSVATVCWESCIACPTNFWNVTFRVDMSNETVSMDGVHITGTFQGFDPAATPMTNVGYGLYEYTISLGEGTTGQYKILNGNTFATEEAVPMECGVDNGLGGYNRTYTVGSGDVIIPVFCFGECEACAGCTDPLSLEFNPFAGSDDGSCATAIVPGCTYSEADNYNPAANDDDGSCVITGGTDCPGDLSPAEGDGVVNAADLLAFLGVFGTSCN